MTYEELVGFGLALMVVILIGVVVSLSRLPRKLKALIYLALGFRVLGSWLRYTILFEVYNGSGDAQRYFRRGRDYAAQFWQLDFSPFYDPSWWVHGRWWGTQFVSFPSGIVVSGLGPALLGEFVIFSLIAFAGLAAFAVAFGRACPDLPITHYARWIWLFPSLWYWPSSVGKEAIVLLGLGLSLAGFIGKREKVSWPVMVMGILLIFAIRPQVAAVVILSLILAHWLSLGSKWTPEKTIQGFVILVTGLGGIWLSMSFVGVESFDVEGVQSYMEAESAGAATGGSAIGDVGVNVGGVPMALVNILTRPFLWEAHNLMAGLSALEIFSFWLIVLYRRKNFVNALRNWRDHRLLRVAVPFILVYSITLGMLIVNLGIIARQRIFLFPFLFLLVEAAPVIDRKLRREKLPAGTRGRSERTARVEVPA